MAVRLRGRLDMAAKVATVSEAGFVNPGIAEPKGPDYVIVEMRHDSRVAYSAAGFQATADVEPAASQLIRTLEHFDVRRVGSLFGMAARQIRGRVTAAPPSLDVAVSAEFAQSGFLQIIPRRDEDAAQLAKQLDRADTDWKAVIAPRPFPAAAATGTSTASRNFEPTQGYLCSPPNGIGAMEIWEKFGAKGKGVTICDIEGNWNFDHEDLPKFKHIGGTLVNNIGWRNHGTAVLGEMVSKPNPSGTVGISHHAKAVVQSAFIDGVWNAAGAIVVGAGIPPTNHFDYFGPDWGFDRYGRIGNPRSRIWFSNYGKIVNVQGWGWHVTSTGYGDAQGGKSENRWYTIRFSGTSSASPIVTSSVACIQGHAMAKLGQPLPPDRVRTILMKTGTPQEKGLGVPLSQNIGPQPNLIKALALV